MLHFLINRSERRIGVKFEYAHNIAETDTRLLIRYNKIFGFLNANKFVSPLAYHTARLRGAIAADCGTCIEAEVNLALKAHIDPSSVANILASNYASLPPEIAAVAELSDAVVANRADDPVARNSLRHAFGDAGLIELAFAMNGAAMLPGIKRAMGYATVCDPQMMRRLKESDSPAP